MARHSSSPVLRLLSTLEARPDTFTATFYTRLFATDPAARELFPADMSRQREVLFRVIKYVFESVEEGHDIDAMAELLAQLGRDHRKYGVLPGHYERFADALVWAMRQHTGQKWTVEMEVAASQIIGMMAAVMRGAAESEAKVWPASWDATVVAHERKTRDLSVVTVEAHTPIPYEAGQYLSVQVPQFPRVWRYYSPATPPNALGQIEFHVRAVEGGSVSKAMASSASFGDHWRIGAPHGGMRIDHESGRDVLMIAGGTGLAPLRALLLDMARYEDNPRVHLFFGARYPGELYDLDQLWELMREHDWLSVVPVSEFDEDPWWLGNTTQAPPFAMYLRQSGTLADVVCSYGRWSDRQILIAGSTAMIDNTVEQMVANGTPRENIEHDPV